MDYLIVITFYGYYKNLYSMSLIEEVGLVINNRI